MELGLIVNPIAGIGGTVAFKGSDGERIVERARRLGATPMAPWRAVDMLRGLLALQPDLEIVTYPDQMGEQEASAAGFSVRVIGTLHAKATTAKDTISAARAMKHRGVGLIVFVGGDGTARDILKAIGADVPAIGVPAGVKMHSSVFAVNPRRAADVVDAFVGGSTLTDDLEVMDIDEEAARNGHLSARLYGYLRVPQQPRLLQGSKARSLNRGVSGITTRIIEEMDDSCHYILGPGSTMEAISQRLGVKSTLLGVDVVHKGAIVTKDATEEDLFRMATSHRCRILVSVVGGQGFVLGRGNPQISPRVIRAVGGDNISIIASPEKLRSLSGPLRVDTGDPECDVMLSGYRRVITDRREDSVLMIEA